MHRLMIAAGKAVPSVAVFSRACAGTSRADASAGLRDDLLRRSDSALNRCDPIPAERSRRGGLKPVTDGDAQSLNKPCEAARASVEIG